MSISRVSGPLLNSNLDRQGVDLEFSTNNQPLFFLDFANFKAAINANTQNATETFTVNGNVKLGSNIKIDQTTISSTDNIQFNVPGSLYLGNVSHVKITGGSDNFVLTTDGTGNLSFKDVTEIANNINLSGRAVVMGTPTDTSLLDLSAYRYWNANTTVSDAADNLNQVLLNVYQDTYVGRADFTSNITSGPSSLSVQFMAETFGNPTHYLWRFGDGMTSTERDPIHTYTNINGGSYSVYFKAYNINGTLNGNGELGDPTLAQGSYADTLKQNYITLYSPAPISTFVLNPQIIDNNGSVQFTNQSQWANNYVVEWGDGNSNIIPDNYQPGGIYGLALNHSYTTTEDKIYEVILHATSNDQSSTPGLIIDSLPTPVSVYIEHAPTFSSNTITGFNQHNEVPNGLTVEFTNLTNNVGATSLFSNNKFVWDFGDGTIVQVDSRSSLSGDYNVPINHTFTLNDPTVEQQFNVTLTVYNGHTNSPFMSTPTTITVKPVPTALFTGSTVTASDKIGDSAQVGYLFTDLNGYERNIITFNNESINANTYIFDFGDGVDSGELTNPMPGTPGNSLLHTYSTIGQFDVSLLSLGENSQNATDDTLLKNNYITILNPPAPPASVSEKTLTIPSISGNAAITSNITNNNVLISPVPGTLVNRITTLNPVVTNTINNVYDGAHGTVKAVVNGTDSPIATMSLGNNTGIYGALTISEDKDAHIVDPNVFPSNFYKVFSAFVSKTNSSTPVGFNTYKISHNLTGETNELSFVKDNVTVSPVLDISTASITVNNPGNLKYISGVPYFNTNGKISISDVKTYYWIGQCYLDSNSPLSVLAGSTVDGTGSVIQPQYKTYADINGISSMLSNGIPIADTGKDISSIYTLGNIVVDINGNSTCTGKIQLTLTNLNGTSNIVELPQTINTYYSSIGLNELNIPVSPTLGRGFTTNGLRVLINSNSETPLFNSSTNYYTDYSYNNITDITGTYESVVRFGVARNDNTDYSIYVPPGPDLSSRSGVQYFRFAFRRTQVANFTVTFSGKITGLFIASPGTQIDQTSTLNGWLDASNVYAGAGIPGANIVNGGNGDNGCAKTSGDVVPTLQVVTNHSSQLTLGSENSSNAFGNQILVCIALDAGDFLSAVSIS